MVAKPSRSLVLRRRHLPEQRRIARDGPTRCPHCGRVTQTVGAGACADCWLPKEPGGKSAIAPREPQTEPLGLLSFLDDVPDIVWLFALIGAAAGLVRILVWIVA